MTSTKHKTTVLAAMALGLLLATLLAALFSPGPAAAAVTSGKAFAWGDNYFGQLGNGQSGLDTETSLPVAVKNLSGVSRVKAGCNQSLALKGNGTVWAWGDNNDGELGNGSTLPYSSLPVKVIIDNVKAISAGCDHSLALKENGTVWAWGDNNYGELGNGSTLPGTDKNVPVKVASLGSGVKGIAAGNDFSLALMNDGTVRAWGDNEHGQLGNGATLPGADLSAPVRVANLSNVKAIATDGFADHALALKNDGTVRSWGYDYHGQLGDGTTLPGTDKSTPVRVANLTGVAAVAAGGTHSLALKGSGRVKAWGNNNLGELGNGTHGTGTDRSTPVSVVGLTDVKAVSGGVNDSLAILQSGRARSWGENYSGQLGNGTSGDTAYSDVPVGVKNITNVKSIDGGFGFALAATQ